MKIDREINESPKIELIDTDAMGIGLSLGIVNLPDSGRASVVWSRNEEGYEHVSVAPGRVYKAPTWKDMCYVKDIFWHADEEVYQIHPKANEYVNLSENCLHLWKVIGHDLRELVKEGTQHGN